MKLGDKSEMIAPNGLPPLSWWSRDWMMNSTIHSASLGSRVIVAFGGTSIDTLATLGPGAVKDADRLGMVDGKGLKAIGWTPVILVVTGRVSLPLTVASAATPFASSDDGMLMLGGAS